MRSLQPPARVLLDRVIFRPDPIPSLLGMLLAFRASEVVIGPHRLVLVERIFGFVWRRIALPWEHLCDAGIMGWRLALVRADGRPLITFVRGDPGQLAWLVAEIKARVAAQLPRTDETSKADADRARVLAIAGRAGSVGAG